jgi:hypothetical protein
MLSPCAYPGSFRNFLVLAVTAPYSATSCKEKGQLKEEGEEEGVAAGSLGIKHVKRFGAVSLARLILKMAVVVVQ